MLHAAVLPAAIHDYVKREDALYRMTMCRLKILFQFLLMFNEWFSFLTGVGGVFAQ